VGYSIKNKIIDICLLIGLFVMIQKVGKLKDNTMKYKIFNKMSSISSGKWNG
jgi:hypothetical protein